VAPQLQGRGRGPVEQAEWLKMAVKPVLPAVRAMLVAIRTKKPACLRSSEYSMDAAFGRCGIINSKDVAIKFGNHLHLAIFAARFEKKGK
jgi:hypothetical protein